MAETIEPDQMTARQPTPEQAAAQERHAVATRAMLADCQAMGMSAADAINFICNHLLELAGNLAQLYCGGDDALAAHYMAEIIRLKQEERRALRGGGRKFDA